MQWCELWSLVAAVDKFVGTRNLIYQGGAGEQRSHRMGFDLRHAPRRILLEGDPQS